LALAPAAQSAQQPVEQRQQNENKQDQDLFYANVFQRSSYRLCPGVGWSPVSAMASRMAVSAWTFFIR
jgi:hypothetical protein